MTDLTKTTTITKATGMAKFVSSAACGDDINTLYFCSTDGTTGLVRTIVPGSEEDTFIQLNGSGDFVVDLSKLPSL